MTKSLVFVLTFLIAGSTYAFDAAKHFKANCAACHTIGAGDAGKAGPDLAGLSKRRKIDWIVKFVNYPDGMISGDPDEAGYEKADELAGKVKGLYKTTMGDQELEKAQVQAILTYIDSLKKQPKGSIDCFEKNKRTKEAVIKCKQDNQKK